MIFMGQYETSEGVSIRALCDELEPRKFRINLSLSLKEHDMDSDGFLSLRELQEWFCAFAGETVSTLD